MWVSGILRFRKAISQNVDCTAGFPQDVEYLKRLPLQTAGEPHPSAIGDDSALPFRGPRFHVVHGGDEPL